MSTTYDSHRCWAHSKVGGRCDQDAAHDGLHSVTVSWDEDECLDPAQMVYAAVLPVPYRQDIPIDAPEAAQEPRTAPQRYCVACEHPWHEVDGCEGRGVAGMSCECRTPV